MVSCWALFRSKHYLHINLLTRQGVDGIAQRLPSCLSPCSPGFKSWRSLSSLLLSLWTVIEHKYIYYKQWIFQCSWQQPIHFTNTKLGSRLASWPVADAGDVQQRWNCDMIFIFLHFEKGTGECTKYNCAQNLSRWGVGAYGEVILHEVKR